MRHFDGQILDVLRPALGTDAVHFVGLGAYDFQMAFGDLRIQNELRVDFCLRGIEYTWQSGPCAIPAWLLIDQVPSNVVLESDVTLTLGLSGGDWLRFHTQEGPYESHNVGRTSPGKGTKLIY